MSLLRRKKRGRSLERDQDPVFQRYQKVIDLIKPLNRRQYTVLKKGMDKIFDGYQELDKIRTEDELIEELYETHPEDMEIQEDAK